MDPFKDQEQHVLTQKVSTLTGSFLVIICRFSTSRKYTLIEKQNFTMSAEDRLLRTIFAKNGTNITCSVVNKFSFCRESPGWKNGHALSKEMAIPHLLYKPQFEKTKEIQARFGPFSGK